MILGCTTEVISYIARLLSWSISFSLNGLRIGIVCITITTAFFTAALYITLGDVMRYVSIDASTVNPMTYAIIFIPCDLRSLVLQGTGSGLTSIASQNDKELTNPIFVMVAGLAFQAATMAALIAIYLYYAFRVWQLQKRSDISLAPLINKQRLAVFTSFFSLAVITIRSRDMFPVVVRRLA